MLILNVADELRAEQENASSCEKNRRALEFKVDNIFKNRESLSHAKIMFWRR